MIILRAPVGEDELRDLSEKAKLLPEEQLYLDKFIERTDRELGMENYRAHIPVYAHEIERVKSIFKNRIAPQRCLLYAIGRAHESIATFLMGTDKKDIDGGNPLERALEFEKAIEFYQIADMKVGWITDYALRQAQSCFGASRFRRKLGETDLADNLNARGYQLISCLFGGAEFTIVEGAIPNHIKLLAQYKIEGEVAKAYGLEKTGKN